MTNIDLLTRRKMICSSLLLLSVLALSACAALLDAATTVGRQTQFIGALVNVAEGASEAYFARHPSLESERKVAAALRTTRRALAALSEATQVGTTASAEDLDAAHEHALEAYSALRSVLDELRILSGQPPDGGAESDAPQPQPLDLPTAVEIANLSK